MNDGIFLLLGSNQGNAALNLKEAAEKIETEAGTILGRSSIYRSEPWGMEQQPDFLNCVLKIASALPPGLLLEVILGIEKQMGRIRLDRWGPRLIDIDLLLYGNEIRTTSTLTLPHPGIPQRRFTLVPLAEIAGELIHPVLNKSIRTLLAECADPLKVERLSRDD